jgi:uncharacterized protein YndB with AHSA1/START domain
MADILQDFPIRASARRVFEAISTPHGLDCWWTKSSTGQPTENAEYTLGFGPQYEWKARVTRCVPDSEFELELTEADADWTGTRIGFRLLHQDGTTTVRFHHIGWPQVNEHYRVSCHCWAMYLRLLRRNIEHGEFIAYEDRLGD